MDYKKFSKPNRYCGGEYGIPKNNRDGTSFCMCFPDTYDVGMSNIGTRILYYRLNESGIAYCERCYVPEEDYATALLSKKLPLTSIESKKPLRDFDFVGFTLQYELCYSNILYMLDLARIPLFCNERGEDCPIIIAGGPCAVNPEPITDFIDVFFIGDAENSILELVRNALGTREERLLAISKFKGFYVPRFYDEQKIKQVKELNLDEAYFPDKALVPAAEIVHDRAAVELQRGCGNGCRFCQAGFIYRPVRERSVSHTAELCSNLLLNTGYDELSLSSLSTSDYSGLSELLGKLKFDNVNISLPSLRLNSFEDEYAESMRKAGITFAPEAGTQRLRDVINKNITDDDFEKSVISAFSKGHGSIKLYFMIGLPTETFQDIEGIVEMAYKVRSLYAKHKQRGAQLKLNVSASVFIPKPFTPFQWEDFTDIDEVLKKQKYIKEKLTAKGIGFHYHGIEESLIEAAFSRGGREMNAVLIRAYQKGAKMDGWSEKFNFKAYSEAITECGLELTNLVKGKDEIAVLPWDFIDIGVSKEFLLRERHKAHSAETSPTCYANCAGCGLKKEGVCKIKQ